jgi:hypothetical protein
MVRTGIGVAERFARVIAPVDKLGEGLGHSLCCDVFEYVQLQFLLGGADVASS